MQGTEKNEGQSSQTQARQTPHLLKIDPKLQAWIDKNTWYGKDGYEIEVLKL